MSCVVFKTGPEAAVKLKKPLGGFYAPSQFVALMWEILWDLVQKILWASYLSMCLPQEDNGLSLLPSKSYASAITGPL